MELMDKFPLYKIEFLNVKLLEELFKDRSVLFREDWLVVVHWDQVEVLLEDQE